MPEALRSEGVLALQASPDLVDFVQRDGRLDPLAVEALARCRFGIQRKVLRVRADQRVGRALRVCGVARLGVVAGLADHACTDRIEFDVAVAAQQVIVGLHRAGLEAAFPEGACATVAIVDEADVAAAE